MRTHTTCSRRFLALSTLLASPGFLAACGQSASRADLGSSEAVLSELAIMDPAVPSAGSAPDLWGDPSMSLIAGDRIAFDVAIAGGYFDRGRAIDGSYYANVEASGFE